MKPKPLKPTPASSPLFKTRSDRLDHYGEPTHPDLVRDPADLAPLCSEDGDWDVEAVWAWVGEGEVSYTFWYHFSDGEVRGIHARANSYAEAARLARTDLRGLPWLCTILSVTVVRLQSVDIHD
jgi:hypothetical protein